MTLRSQARKKLVNQASLMPIQVTIDPQRQLVITTCFGLVTADEFLQAREQVLADTTFDPTFDRLWDFSSVTGEQVSEELISRLVKTSPFAGDILRAVVVSLSPKTLARILEFIAESRRFNRRIAAFPTREAAEGWIQSERCPSPAAPEEVGARLPSPIPTADC